MDTFTFLEYVGEGGGSEIGRKLLILDATVLPMAP